MRSDLHIHTSNSDGTHSLDEIVSLCQSLSEDPVVISITDHHLITTHTIKVENNLTIIPGIEVSCTYNKHSLHMLGYSAEVKSIPQFLDLLNTIKDGYQNRSSKVHEKLTSLGYELPNLMQLRDPSLPGPIYTYDFASYFRKKLALKSDKEAIQWAREQENLFFVGEDNFLPPAEEVIHMLLKANYIPCLAHPGTRFAQSDEDIPFFQNMLSSLVDYGLQGLEVYYPKHTDTQSHVFLAAAQKHNLLITGGSDFHGWGRGVDSPSFMLKSPHIENIMQKLSSI